MSYSQCYKVNDVPTPGKHTYILNSNRKHIRAISEDQDIIKKQETKRTQRHTDLTDVWKNNLLYVAKSDRNQDFFLFEKKKKKVL